MSQYWISLIQWYLKLLNNGLRKLFSENTVTVRWALIILKNNREDLQFLLLWFLIASIYSSMKEYANEKKSSDDEVYKKIRNYESQKQFSLKMRWWTLLFTHRVRNLKQLLRHEKFILAFDTFLKIPALLTEMRISILYKMFAIKCDEVIVSSSIVWMRSSIVRKLYIIFITSSNSDLICFSKIRSLMIKVNQVIVKALQIIASWTSILNVKILRDKMLNEKFFCRFNQQERERIWIKL